MVGGTEKERDEGTVDEAVAMAKHSCVVVVTYWRTGSIKARVGGKLIEEDARESIVCSDVVRAYAYVHVSNGQRFAEEL